MSTERGAVSSTKRQTAAKAQRSDQPAKRIEPQSTPTQATVQLSPSSSTATSPPRKPNELSQQQQQHQPLSTKSPPTHLQKKPSAKRDPPSVSTSSPSTLETSGAAAATGSSSQQQPLLERPRQVIAVSATKGPAAFFNLARKFLVTDELCDLSALEGAIVSAVDAAHLLERSKLATIERVQTSYVTVEPKRRRQMPSATDATAQRASPHGQLETAASAPTPLTRQQRSGREMRRARIVITVKRTENYQRWLEENPLQAVIAGDGDEDAAEEDDEEREPGGGVPSSKPPAPSTTHSRGDS